MDDSVLGAGAAVLASSLFSFGLILQSLDVRDVGEDQQLRVRAMLRLLRRPRWVLGGVAMAASFGLHTQALTLASLTVVQPALSAGLLVLLAYGLVSTGEQVGGREAFGVVAIAAGIVGLTLTAPDRSKVSADAATLVMVLGGLVAIALVPVLLLRVGRGLRGRVLLMAIGAGAAYSASGVTTKLFSDGLDSGDQAAAVFWLVVTGASGLLALLDQTAALARGPTTQVGVIIYVAPVVVPVIAAPALVGERWTETPGGGTLLALSVLVVCTGAALLGSSRRVAAIEAGAT